MGTREDAMPRMRSVRLGLVAVLGALALACVLGDDVARAAAVLVATVIAAAATVASPLRTAAVTRAARLAHAVLLGGLVLLAAHNAQALGSRLGGVGEPPGPVFASTLALGYLALLIGGTLVTVPLGGRDLGSHFDNAIVAVVVTSVAWSAVVRPVQDANGMSGSAQLYEFVIILLVSGMAGIVIRAWSASTGAREPIGYLLAAVLAVVAGHLMAVLTHDPATGSDSPWIDVWWLVAYLGLAAAFQHPAAPLMGTHERRAARLSRRRLVLLGLALAVLPLGIVAVDVAAHDSDGLLLAVSAVALVPLVLGRIATLASLHAEAERRLDVLANHDELTGLPNRRAVARHLADVLERVADGRSPGVTVLFLDLDDFKLVNDEHGHTTGDRLLVEVARRLRAAVRSTDLVARFGGDEFLVAMEGEPLATRDAALGTLSAALAGPVDLDDVRASARASIGVTLVRPGERTTAEHVLSAADAAMYVVKRRHRAGRTEPDPAGDADGDALEHAPAR
jgi:diguanylate cyclase (GGDEF)-like protein